MSTSIKELYHFELIKKCSKCEIILLKCNFSKISPKRMVIDLLAKFAVKSIIIMSEIEY